MSGVEVASALLSLAALTTSILEPIQRYQHDFKGLKLLQVELSALSEVMNALRPLVESPDGRRVSIPPALFQSCGETLLETQKIIDSVTSKSTPRYQFVLARLKYRQRLKELQDNLDRHKSTFAIILTSITSLQANVTENEIRALHEQINELHLEKVLQLPGMGKSVIMNCVVDRLTSTEAKIGSTAVTYFFNDFREQGSNALARIVASLLRQAVQCLPSLPHDIVLGYETIGRLDRRPSFSFLRAQLLRVIAMFRRFYVLVDGFDELPSEDRSELTELANSLVQANACVFISSRPVHDLPQPKRTRDLTPVLIRLEYQQSYEIETYVEQNLSTMKQLNNKHELREAIRKRLLEGANGMFLWVNLQLEELSKLKRLKDMQQTLLIMPRELKDVYNGMLLEISRNQEQFDLARQVFQALLFAKVPISVDNLMGTDRTILVDLEDIDVYRSKIDTIVARCGGFIRIEPSTNIVQFTHQTAREFLLTSDNLKRLADSETQNDMNEPAAHDSELLISLRHKPLIENTEDGGSIDLDSASVKSWSSSILSEVSDTSSQTSIMSQMRSVCDQYADIFAHNDRCRPVILACIERLGVTGFEHLFADALKTYSADLQSHAKTGSQQIAAIMAGQRTQVTARQTLVMSGFLETHQINTRIVEHADKPRSDAFVDRILGLRNQQTIIASDGKESFKSEKSSTTVIRPSLVTTQVTKTKSNTAHGRAGSNTVEYVDDEDEDCTQIYQNLDLVKAFLTTTEAFEKLINRLQTPVQPSELADPICKPRDSKTTIEVFHTMLAAVKSRAWTLLQSTLAIERPLESGMKRVRWTCVCDRQFYDDFLEVVPGAVDELQTSLETIYNSPTSSLSAMTTMETRIASFDIQATGSPIEMEVESSVKQLEKLVHGGRSFTSSLPPDPGTTQRTQTLQSLMATGSSSINSEQYVPVERPGRQGNESSNKKLQTSREVEPSIDKGGDTTLPNRESQQQSQEGENKQDNVLTEDIYDENKQQQVARSGHRAKHISVGEQTCDSELFGDFREKYFKERSWLRRFVELKEVSKLDFVQFNLTDVNDASIIRYDVWPPQEVSTAVLPAQDLKQEWYYKPCPVKQIPLVGTDHLLHIWRNPHHADHRAYQEWLKSKGVFRRFLEWLRNWPVRVRQRFFGVPMPQSNGQAGNTALRFEPEDRLPPSYVRSRYIIVKIPKKIGEELKFDLGNDDPISG
ncbi:hypothetical protein MMC27_004273 [Xylographa pallens]|nr:hypothetical protein [Xylographa pallens]